MVLVNQSIFDEIEDTVQFISALFIASQQLLLHVGVVRLVLFQDLAVLVQSLNLA